MTDQVNVVTMAMINAIESSNTKSIRTEDGTVWARTTEGNLVIANKGAVIARCVWGSIKEMATVMWSWLKRIAKAISGFFERLMNWLSGNGFVLTHKAADGSITAESVEERATRKGNIKAKAQMEAVLA